MKKSNLTYKEQLTAAAIAARKRGDAEAELYYLDLINSNSVASVSFEYFKGAWGYEEWKKRNKERIEERAKEMERMRIMGCTG